MTRSTRKKPSGRSEFDMKAALCYLLMAVAAAIFVYTAIGFDLTQDDAYISFRYAQNLIDGEGLVYNAGERVEGYTNFLWVIILAFAKLVLGLDFLLVSRVLGVAAGALMFFLVYLLLRAHGDDNLPLRYAAVTALMLLNLSLPYWAIASLETIPFACVVLAALVAEYRRPRITPILLVCATLLRPEGALVFGVVVLNRLIRKRAIPWKLIVWYAAPLLPFAVFKLLYYGSLFPNPYYAKSGVGLEYIASGLEYTWHFTTTLGVYGILFLLPLAAIRQLWDRYSLLYLFVLLYAAYIIWVGGDVLKVYRFFVPAVAALYLLVVASVYELLQLLRQRRMAVGLLTLVVTSALAIGAHTLSKDHIRTYEFYERNLVGKMHFLGYMLKKHMGQGFSVAASTIGMIGYQLVGNRVIDLLGLTDSYIARNPEKIEGIVSTWKERRFNNTYLLSQSPDFIIFSTGYKPSAPAERALMLHSEFRRNYRTVGFFRVGGGFKVTWRRIGEIDMARDAIHPDIEFVTKFSDALYHFNNTGPEVALVHFRESQARLGEAYSVIDFMTGDCFLKMGSVDSASFYFEKALALDPNCWECRIRLANVAAAQGDTATARLHDNTLRAEWWWIFDTDYVPLGSGEF